MRKEVMLLLYICFVNRISFINKNSTNRSVDQIPQFPAEISKSEVPLQTRSICPKFSHFLDTLFQFWFRKIMHQ